MRLKIWGAALVLLAGQQAHAVKWEGVATATDGFYAGYRFQTDGSLGYFDDTNILGPGEFRVFLPGSYSGNGRFEVGPEGTLSGTLTIERSLSGAVPEPASRALLIAGFGIIGVAARRQRRAAQPG
jgi:hypothetical protein